MSVSNGQPANADTFNNAFVSKSADSTITSRVTLSRTGSGAQITDAQSAINTATSNISQIQTDVSTLQNDLLDKVSGPASSVDSRLAAFDGTTGKLIKDSGITAGSLVTVPVTPGVVKSYGTVLSTSPVSLTTEVSGVLPTANGGTGQNSTANYPTSGNVATVPASGVVKSNGTILLASPVSLTTEVTGTLPIANGGTGQITSAAAFDALAPTTTKGDLIARSTTTNGRVPVGVDGQVLIADSAQTLGVRWGSVSASGLSATRSVTGTYTATADDETLRLSGASFTLTLPTAVGQAGKRYRMIHGGTSLTQSYTMATTASQTIGGVAGGQYVLHTNGEVLEIESDGANWIITGRQANTAPQTFTPGLYSSAGTAPTRGTVTYELATWTRIGQYVKIAWTYRQSTAGTIGAGPGHYCIITPAGINADTSLVSAAPIVVNGWMNQCGSARIGSTAGGGGNPSTHGCTWLEAVNRIGVFYEFNNETVTAWGTTAYPFTSALLFVSLQAMFPVAGWRP